MESFEIVKNCLKLLKIALFEFIVGNEVFFFFFFFSFSWKIARKFKAPKINVELRTRFLAWHYESISCRNFQLSLTLIGRWQHCSNRWCGYTCIRSRWDASQLIAKAFEEHFVKSAFTYKKPQSQILLIFCALYRPSFHAKFSLWLRLITRILGWGSRIFDRGMFLNASLSELAFLSV